MPSADHKPGFLAILVMALVAAALLRLGAVEGRRVWWHDEGISFLAATGHQATYAETVETRTAPYGRWESVSDWRRLVLNAGPVSLRRIARELASHDIHPPLYFWLLHLVSLVAGVSVWTGPSLNAMLDLVTITLVFATARDALGDSRWAAVAALFWALSPATIEASVEARQYALFGLLTIAFTRQFARAANVGRCTTRTDLVALVALAALVCAGMLSHYYFAIVLVGASLIVISGWSGGTVRGARASVAALAAGVAGSVAIHPWFVNSFSKANDQAQSFQLPDLWHRLARTASSNLAFFADERDHKAIFALVLVALLIWAIASWRRGTLQLGLRPPALGPHLSFVVSLMLGVFLVLDVVYLGFISPEHAMGAKYLAPAWPLLAIVVTAIVRALPERCLIASALCGFMLAVSRGYVGGLRKDEAHAAENGSVLRDAPQAVVDNPARGVLLPLIFHMLPEQRVFVAGQDDLLTNPDEWLPPPEVGPVLYATCPSYGNADDAHDRILEVFAAEGWAASEEGANRFVGWNVYRLEREGRGGMGPR